ncbi:hypothetical protein [Lentiprolixibacter aurantiacus]|uniref:Uncharacterized protein n=1 Tax=Lentiprolixibacter aurantiacus TaxID=2993939 RepID=A0AAE3SMZ4_9FLAO|nr:hypothetical protein [Lentiprolixibacter aurantiacus]MCX2718980.1 hypothetical protein [Lentiprolixibacter aurantiacus]
MTNSKDKLPEFENSLSLLQGASAKALYKALINQLSRDFGRANILASFHEEMTPEELLAALKEKLYVLLLEHFDDYLNLMYLIDVPESALKDLKLTDAVEVAGQLSFLILRREWQKVWLKAHYRS